MDTVGARRWWALGAMALAVFTVTLDVTVINVALPTLAGALKASEAQLQWFVTGYTLALVAGMLPAGLIGDRYGRKTLLCGGLLLFVAGSLGCAYATGPEMFLVARVALGLAGAALIVMVLSLITVLFSEAERPRAVGIWGAANFIGLPLGPILGGWLLSNVWWGWVFLMNVQSRSSDSSRYSPSCPSRRPHRRLESTCSGCSFPARVWSPSCTAWWRPAPTAGVARARWRGC